MTQFSRRDIAKVLGGAGIAALGFRAASAASPTTPFVASGYGPLQSDPARLIDLPKGFSYRVISRLGNIMDDGLPVPNKADGMGAFAAGPGKVALVRNHELKVKDESPSGHFEFLGRADPALPVYDRTDDGRIIGGGTSTLIYDLASQTVTAEWMSLAGTIRNCAGGVTPWGSW